MFRCLFTGPAARPGVFDSKIGQRAFKRKPCNAQHSHNDTQPRTLWRKAAKTQSINTYVRRIADTLCKSRLRVDSRVLLCSDHCVADPANSAAIPAIYGVTSGNVFIRPSHDLNQSFAQLRTCSRSRSTCIPCRALATATLCPASRRSMCMTRTSGQLVSCCLSFSTNRQEDSCRGATRIGGSATSSNSMRTLMQRRSNLTCK